MSAEKFSYFVNVRELELIALKEKIVDLVNNNQKEEAYGGIKEYKKLTKGKNMLYIQFYMLSEAVLEWKNDDCAEKILKKILEAWDMTRKSKAILRVRGQYLSYFEMAFTMLYMRLLEEREVEILKHTAPAIVPQLHIFSATENEMT